MGKITFDFFPIGLNGHTEFSLSLCNLFVTMRTNTGKVRGNINVPGNQQQQIMATDRGKFIFTNRTSQQGF